MATEDGKIIINPYSNLSDAEKKAVAENEGLRLWMRENNFVPDFVVTPEQREKFKGTEYGKPENEKFLKQTNLHLLLILLMMIAAFFTWSENILITRV
ncbi:MAG: hypothetical protein EOM17_16070, partial [Synergistales bacterium]|nr:hypothetical protein [Synergistales bacterium]